MRESQPVVHRNKLHVFAKGLMCSLDFKNTSNLFCSINFKENGVIAECSQNLIRKEFNHLSILWYLKHFFQTSFNLKKL